MDYRELLKKYMALVITVEGIDYLDSVNYLPKDFWKEGELAELHSISNESLAVRPSGARYSDGTPVG